MKCIPYITTAFLLTNTLFLTSCDKKDPETKRMEDVIAILEDVIDKDSADKASVKLMDVEISALQYKRDNIKLLGKYREFIKDTFIKNHYNSEKLRDALAEKN